MSKEIAAANDDEFTKDELAVILTRQWLADGGALLKRQVENAHAFFVKYLVQDLNSTAVPQISGAGEELEISPGEWIVRRVGGSPTAGTYECVPDATGDITMFATYGDYTAISKVQRDRIRLLKTKADKDKKK